MAVPQERNLTKPFNPPAWMVKKADENAARLGYAPDALAKKLREAREKLEEMKRKANEHAARMGADFDVVTKKLTETRAGLAERPELDIDMAVRASVEHAETVKQPVTTEAPYILQLPIPSEQSRPAPATQSHSRREAQVELRDGRRQKKEKVRSKSTKMQTTKSTSPSGRSSANPTIAESSTAGTTPEVAVAATEPMGVDHLPSFFVNQKDRYPVRKVLPKWYTGIKDSSYNMVQLSKRRPQALTALESLKNCIGRCEAEAKRGQLNKLYEELRDHVHKAEITLEVNKYILKKARILNAENGLPRIFKADANFPPDLKADSYQLYSRWLREDFSQDILRGIITKGKDRNADSIDPAYRAKHPSSAKFYGEGDLVLGQWWPTQLCTVRDGAHGAAQGGIFGDKENGAYSIVLSSGGYHDKDDGDVIEYSGTEGKNFTSTDATLAMIQSIKLGNEIRVIRSSMLVKKNKYRPERGLRYDGLYKIRSYELVDKEKQMYRFKLERCPGQEPIRCENNAARRPTIYEIIEIEKERV